MIQDDVLRFCDNNKLGDRISIEILHKKAKLVLGHNPPDMYPPDTYPKDIYPLDTYPLDTYPQDTYPLGHILQGVSVQGVSDRGYVS